MSDSFDTFRAAAASEGYELVHGEEGYGENFFGCMILVKMSNRKFDRDRDWNAVYDAAKVLRRGFDTVSEQVRPDADEIRESYRREIEGIYDAAGMGRIYMEELPNGYCPDPCCLNRPWFRVTSSIGHVVIGWRKRVIQIEWKDTIVKKSAEELFPDEKVTKLETSIHAWGSAKAAEYVKRLHGVA